jgi:hypothetical protein
MYATKKTNLRIAGIVAASLVMAMGGRAQASIFTFDFDIIIVGPAPGGSNIATLTIADTGVNSVLITLDHHTTSAAGQFITDLHFNLNPYTPVIQSGQAPANKFDGPLLQGSNTEHSAGLNFDFRQGFVATNGNGGADRLRPGESVSFSLTGSGISASSFVSSAFPNGENRTDVIAMIHVQGLQNGESVKLGAVVPEPVTLAGLAIGLGALLRKRRSR